jgi:L-ectoine synthase
MIVRSLEQILGTERDIDSGSGHSRRLLLEADGMGFTLTDTFLKAGNDTYLQYKNHLESNYCIEGEGEVEGPDGTKYPLRPGVMYCLDKHDAHHLRAFTDLRLICVFTPPLKGPESHAWAGPGEPSGY